MKRQRILLDVDGVLADFVTPALEIVRNVTGAPVPEDALEDWDIFRAYPKDVQNKFYDAFKCEGWCMGLEPYPGSQEGIALLERVADVYFVTSPMHGPHWAYERTLWLKKYFGVPAKRVVHTNAKYLCVGDIFVDDKFDHVENWQKAHPHGCSVLWTQPYNRKNEWPHRATCWEEVHQLVSLG